MGEANDTQYNCRMHILPIASGKGGVGKSLIAANLSVALSQSGKKVILADLDLGGSNIHTILGFRSIEMGIGTFLSNRRIPFREIVLETDYSGLLFIPGDAEIPGIANLKSYQKRRLLKQLFSLEADYLIVDLGSGTHSNVLDFFLASGSGLIVVTPALTSILNAYLFLKNAVFRIMYSAFPRGSKAFEMIEEMRKKRASLQRVYIPMILARVKEDDPDSYRLYQERIADFHPSFVLNMIEDPKDDEKARKLRRSCQEYLGTDLQHLGVIYRDDLQDIALSSRLPILVYKPDSILSQAIYRLADKLIQLEIEGGSPINLQNLDTTYQTAELEAESDFQAKLSYIEELMHSGALTMGDLVETIKSQQFELSQLKKENQLLKLKLKQAIEKGYEP